MSRRTIPVLAAAAVVLVAAALLNPSPDRHRAGLRETVTQRSPLAGALGLGAVAAFASTYHTLGVASYTKVGDRLATVGAFGMVFTLNATAAR